MKACQPDTYCRGPLPWQHPLKGYPIYTSRLAVSPCGNTHRRTAAGAVACTLCSSSQECTMNVPAPYQAGCTTQVAATVRSCDQHLALADSCPVKGFLLIAHLLQPRLHELTCVASTLLQAHQVLAHLLESNFAPQEPIKCV